MEDLFRAFSAELGFAEVYVTDTAPFDDWLAVAEATGDLHGLTHDPKALLPDATRLLVLVYPYEDQPPPGFPQLAISPYYEASHRAHQKSETAAAWLTERGYQTLAHPKLPAKAAAQRAGAGRYGRNGLIASKQYGSRVTLQLLLTAAPFAFTESTAEAPLSGCAACRRCVSACPTQALPGDSTVDTNRCLRAHMLSGQVVPEKLRKKMKNRLIGCEYCQSVCPKNAPDRPSVEANGGLFLPDILQENPAAALQTLAERIGGNNARRQRVVAQAALAAGNSGDVTLVPALEQLLGSTSAAIDTHARWAIEQLQKQTQSEEEQPC